MRIGEAKVRLHLTSRLKHENVDFHLNLSMVEMTCKDQNGLRKEQTELTYNSPIMKDSF